MTAQLWTCALSRPLTECMGWTWPAGRRWGKGVVGIKGIPGLTMGNPTLQGQADGPALMAGQQTAGNVLTEWVWCGGGCLGEGHWQAEYPRWSEMSAASVTLYLWHGGKLWTACLELLVGSHYLIRTEVSPWGRLCFCCHRPHSEWSATPSLTYFFTLLLSSKSLGQSCIWLLYKHSWKIKLY